LLTNAKLTVVHVTSLGMEETVFSPPGLGNNAVQTEQINIQNVKEIRLDLPASGALSFISFCQPIADSPTTLRMTVTPPTPLLTDMPPMPAIENQVDCELYDDNDHCLNRSCRFKMFNMSDE
jgi:hypothetical protein